MADSPSLGAAGPLGIAIKVDGTALANDVQILSVETTNRVGQIAECRIVLADGSAATLEFPLADATTLAPGGEVTVEAFYGGDAAEEIFAGLIVGLRTRVTGGNATTTLELDCRSPAAKLHQVRASALYNDNTASGIIEEVLGDAGLTATVDATATQYAQTLRNDCTDWEYVRLLAERSGLLLYCDGTAVMAKAPDLAAASALSVEFGTDLLDFDLEVSSLRSFEGATVRTWDIAAQDVADAPSTPFTGPEWGNLTLSTLADVLIPGDPKGPILTTPAAPDADLAGDAAKAIVQGTELGRVFGTIRFQGSAKAKPNTSIDIAGLSARVSGKAFVTGVSHSVRDGTWTTTTDLGAVPQSDNFAPLRPPVVAGGLTAPIHGLQVGIVTKRDADPAGLARIQITLPLLSDDSEGIWARLAAPYAGAETGISFLPETGDEVIVAFLGGDPSAPVILGAVHSPDRAGPVEGTEDNFDKMIQTKSGLKVTFNDDSPSVTIDTPGGAQVLLDDDAKVVKLTDQNSNVVELAEGGITLTSPKDITLKGDNITLDAQSNAEIKAGMDVGISGMNVTAEAQTAATVKGSASAELSASGNTTVKGAMVMIN